MIVANRQDFLTCLDKYPSLDELEVFASSKRHLLAAVDEVGFEDFHGHDYEVIWRLENALRHRNGDSALWGLVFIDLWYCRNFGGQQWDELVARAPANVWCAIQTAYWVFAESGANGGRALAAIINRCRCWDVAQQYIPSQPEHGLRVWWQRSVLPYRSRGCGCG